MGESHLVNGTRGLVVVTRAPGSDGAKTRLAHAIGVEACASLQSAFLADTIAWGAPLAGRRLLSVFPPSGVRALAAAADGWAVAPQVGEDFGERMRGAVNAGFAGGLVNAIVLNSVEAIGQPSIVRVAAAPHPTLAIRCIGC